MWMRPLGLCLCLLLAACTDSAPRGGGDIVVLGDSVLAWNGSGGQSVGDGIAAALGRDVTDRAVPGAQFTNSNDFTGAVGFDIRRQMPEGRWNWVVLNGGANDLNADCGCGACGREVDALIGPGGVGGAIPPYLARLRRGGARVLWVGYYEGTGSGPFAGCRDDLVEMEARIAQLAAAIPGIHFADAEDVFDSRDPASYAADRVHPSARSSMAIGAYLARTIAAAEARSQTE